MTHRRSVSRTSTALRCAIVLILGPALLAAPGCWGSAEREAELEPIAPRREIEADRYRLALPEAPGGTYVGSAKCVACHEEISKRYQSHPMAHASAAVDQVAAIEDFGDKASFAAAGRLHYRVQRTDEGIFHHEQMRDRDDEVIYDRHVPIHFEIGSGKRGRSYATDRNGILFLSPISWYSEHSRWDLSPGYEESDRPRFERRLLDGCLHCHVGQMAREGSQPDRFVAPVMVEGPISCERCHGPGGQHVAHHESGAAETAADTIVNPARLTPLRRDDVCYQCHLQGSGRLLRYGRSEYDFRPGMKLSDIWTVFVEGTRVSADGTTKAVSQVEQMLASKCYQASDGRLGCISCHDPHEQPDEAERVAVYRQRCLKCHQETSPCSAPAIERDAANDSCIACHMPRLAANDIPHTSQTDHLVPRRPGVSAAARVAESSGEQIFGDAEHDVPLADRQRAQGLVLIVKAQLENDPFLAFEALNLLQPIMDANPRDLRVMEAVADGYLVQRHYQDAKRLWEQVLQADPDNESVLQKMALFCNESGQLDDAVGYLDRLIEINPWHEHTFGRKSHILAQLGQIRPAIDAGLRCLELNPGAVQVHEGLAEGYEALGDVEQARKHRKMAEKIRQNIP